MKSVKRIWEKIIAEENIREAFYNAAKGKKDRDDVKRVLSNIDFHVQELKNILEETTPEDKTKGYRPKHEVRAVINESSSKKVRTIDKPRYKYDQVIHHAVMQQLIPHIQKGMYEHVYGSIPKCGAHLAKKNIQKWIENDPKNTKYVLQMDIRHFYESIDHDVLKNYLKSRIKDKYVLNILFIIIDQIDVGLPLGFYTSQWLSNYLLQPFDYFVKQKLKAKYYVRYADDILIFGANKKELHKICKEIQMYMQKELKLQIKNNYQVYKFESYSKKKRKTAGRAIDFIGFEFHRNRTILRKSIMLSATRKARRIGKKKKKTHHDASSMLSRMGYIKHTDTYHMYEKHIKPYVKVKEMKRIVSKHSRKEQKK